MDFVIIAILIISILIEIVIAVRLSRKSTDSRETQAVLDQILARLGDSAAASDRNSALMRQEILNQFKALGDSSLNTMTQISTSTQANLEQLRATVDARLSRIQSENEKQLNEMRQTVDQKLTETLGTGLANSFQTVNTQLEQVYKSMGEMRSLAQGVVDLKNILANVKTRGGWGEVQLGRLIEDILAPGQYAQNVSLGSSREAVEYAIKLPGLGEEPVFLPIDSKFPMDRYTAVLSANESGNPAEISSATQTLLRAVRDEAKKIHDKYILPPQTTDFAVLFVPSEGLYALLAENDMGYQLQHDLRIMLAGPSTLSALLNSLQVGFKSVAIEQQSVEISRLLGAVKKAFENLSGNIDKSLKSLQAATNHLNTVRGNTRTIQSKLRNVEELSEDQSRRMLGDGFFPADEDSEA